MKIVFVVVLIFSLVLVSSVNATSSEMFVNHISGIIYSDCVNENIEIKEPYIQNTLTKENVTLVEWPYEYIAVHRILEILGEYEPYNDYFDGCEVKGSGYLMGKDGCEILNVVTTPLILVNTHIFGILFE